MLQNATATTSAISELLRENQQREEVGVKSAKRQLDLGLKLNLNGKRLYPTDDHLAFKQHIVGISAKLNKANALVSKIRH